MTGDDRSRSEPARWWLGLRCVMSTMLMREFVAAHRKDRDELYSVASFQNPLVFPPMGLFGRWIPLLALKFTPMHRA